MAHLISENEMNWAWELKRKSFQAQQKFFNSKSLLKIMNGIQSGIDTSIEAKINWFWGMNGPVYDHEAAGFLILSEEVTEMHSHRLQILWNHVLPTKSLWQRFADK